MNQPALPQQSDEDLRAWDWRAALSAEDRSLGWLARRTGWSTRSVYGYSRGEREPSIEFLREAAAVLGKDVAA